MRRAQKRKLKAQLHILMVSLSLVLAVIFVITGIGVASVRSGQSSLQDGIPAAITEKSPLLYEISFMGQKSTADLSRLNRLVGFIHQNSFLIPPPLQLLQQTTACVYLAYADGQTLNELVFPYGNGK
ncbi:MAG: hypothetical protein IKV41_03135 [Oscillospiraceae bacterium]|nr:hypothetical protein [Oscillospiraceae bacterium]